MSKLTAGVAIGGTALTGYYVWRKRDFFLGWLRGVIRDMLPFPLRYRFVRRIVVRILEPPKLRRAAGKAEQFLETGKVSQLRQKTA